MTALHLAIESGGIEIARLLLKRGAEVDRSDYVSEKSYP